MESLAVGPNPQTASAAAVHHSPAAPRIRLAFLCAAVFLGFIQLLANRNAMNVDGISYADMADSYLRTGWAGLVNGQWSPLYPWLIAVAKSIVKPSAYWEFTLLHGVNFFTYLLAFAAFDFLMRQVIENQGGSLPQNQAPLPEPTLIAIGYTLFLWCSLGLISIRQESPDMLMSGLVYLAAAIILQIRRSGTWIQMICLGAVLGLGYLAKAPMFPLAFVFLAIAFWLIRHQKKAPVKLLLATAVFFAVCAPLVIGLSRAKHRFTFGDSARLNVLWNIDRAGPLWYWQTLGSAGGKFEHRPEKIFQFPAVYKFDAPLPGTQPAWYDPSYWIEGAVPRFRAREQISLLAANLRIYADMLFVDQAPLLAVLVILFSLSDTGLAKSISGQWPILIPALAALGMYALILIETRYVGVFLALLWLGLFAGVRLPERSQFEKLGRATALAIVIAVGIPVMLGVFRDAAQGLRHPAYPHWQVAQELHQAGVKKGDKVARIGGTFGADWARLLRARVVAEIPRYEAAHFWTAGPALQSEVIDTIGKTGAKAIVAEQIPPSEVFTAAPGWKRVGNTDFYVFVYEPASIGNGQSAPSVGNPRK